MTTQSSDQSTQLSATQKKLHRTSGIERRHRDNSRTASTKVVARDERGEVPD